MKVFSTFTGIGGFELGIQDAYRSTHRRSETDSERNQRQGLLAKERQEASSTQRLSSERDNNIFNERPLFVGYSEIDKYACSVYERHFPGVHNYGDITTIAAGELPDFDLLVGGFPCQAFSIAGKRQGFQDTRGTLFFDLARILQTKQPRYFVFENVKGLLSHDNGQTFKTIVETITELGYDCQWQVLNSKDFGVPQNRERVFIVGHLRGTSRPKVFPITSADRQAGGSDEIKVGTLRTHKDGNGFREMKSGIAPTIPARARNDGSGQAVIMTASPKYVDGKRTVSLRVSDTAPTIRATQHKSGDNQPKVLVQPVMTPERSNKKQNGRQIKPDGEPAFTLNTQDQHGVFDGIQVRRLTPLECERLQGFPDYWTKYDKENKEVSDTQRYKMCGNAVTTNVVAAVTKKLLGPDNA